MTKGEIKAAAEQCISMPDNSLQRIFDRLNTRLNDVLCEMKPDYDDSMVGFNEAWDVMRAVFKDELAKAALTGDVAQRPRKQPSTPLPWKFSPWHIEEGSPVVRAPSGYIVCTTASDQDAEYIAEACNAYAAQPPAAPVETPPCVHKTCDDPEWCAGEPKCRYAHSSAGNVDAAKPKELLAIANHIDTGLSRERDADVLFAPPLSIREWREIVAALRHSAGATNALTSDLPQTSADTSEEG